MIFAAGLGTRLDPVTRNTPKALMEVGGKPLLLWVAEKLMAAGVKDIVVNIHHHAEKIRQYVNKLDFKGVRFHLSDETDLLLDTGGGLKKAMPVLDGDEAFFLYNADVLSNIDLDDMWDYHHRQNAVATLAVSKRKSSRYFLFEDDRLAGWQNERNNKQVLVKNIDANKTSKLAFSGIHLVSPEIFGLIEETGSFSIKDLYLRIAAHHKITGYDHDPEGWMDIGTPEKLRKARFLASLMK